jgi:hypothetical protein
MPLEEGACAIYESIEIESGRLIDNPITVIIIPFAKRVAVSIIF